MAESGPPGVRQVGIITSPERTRLVPESRRPDHSDSKMLPLFRAIDGCIGVGQLIGCCNKDQERSSGRAASRDRAPILGARTASRDRF